MITLLKSSEKENDSTWNKGYQYAWKAFINGYHYGEISTSKKRLTIEEVKAIAENKIKEIKKTL